MHKELQELIDVLHVLGGKSATNNETIYFLDNICKKINDEYFGAKNNYLLNNQEECLNAFKSCCKEVSEKCKSNSCFMCPVRKWCNRFRLYGVG